MEVTDVVTTDGRQPLVMVTPGRLPVIITDLAQQFVGHLHRDETVMHEFWSRGRVTARPAWIRQDKTVMHEFWSRGWVTARPGWVRQRL